MLSRLFPASPRLAEKMKEAREVKKYETSDVENEGAGGDTSNALGLMRVTAYNPRAYVVAPYCTNMVVTRLFRGSERVRCVLVFRLGERKREVERDREIRCGKSEVLLATLYGNENWKGPHSEVFRSHQQPA